MVHRRGDCGQCANIGVPHSGSVLSRSATKCLLVESSPHQFQHWLRQGPRTRCTRNPSGRHFPCKSMSWVVCSCEFLWPPSWKFCIRCILFWCSTPIFCTSSSLCAPTRGTCPAECCPATCSRASAATMPWARLHSGSRAHRCSAPRSFGIGCTLFCSTKDVVRCFQPATAASFERRPLAEILSALHTMIPKKFV